MTYAIIRSGGKQHKVSKGDVFRVEKLDYPVSEDGHEMYLLVGTAK